MPSDVGVTVLISGSGTNLQALIDAVHENRLQHVRLLKVISDRKDAFGLSRAEKAGIPTARHGILPYKKKFPDSNPNPTFDQARSAYDADLATLVLEDSPRLVVCAGFMRILTPSFLEPLAKENVTVINLHPALHGDLAGANCIQRAWKEFEEGKRKKTGIMIHHVITEVDRGQMIVQREVDIEGCGRLEDLEARIREVEHELIVVATGMVVKDILGKS